MFEMLFEYSIQIYLRKIRIYLSTQMKFMSILRNIHRKVIFLLLFLGYTAYSRPRQNSVFVGPSPNQFLMPKPPRKTRSAMDLHSMILDESAEQV